jgi:hypothetical protein
VLPTADETCPSCHKYQFTGAQQETAPAAIDPVAARANAANLYEGAQLHWRLVRVTAGLVFLVFLRFGLRLAGRDVLRDAGLEPDVAKVVVAVSLMALAIGMWTTARSLTRWLGLVDQRSGAPSSINVFSLLKHSMTYFESVKVPVGFLGPRLTAMEEPDQEEAS